MGDARRRSQFVLLMLAAAGLAGCGQSAAADFNLVGEIALAGVSGRIDHLAIDLETGRLFVAELGNGSVSEIDLETNSVIARATGLREPQGIAYLNNRVFVATGGDGLLHALSSTDLSDQQTLQVGGDADNVHLNSAGDLLAVGYYGGLALVNPHSLEMSGVVALSGHVEGFAFNLAGDTVFANIPAAGVIAEIAIPERTVGNLWSTAHDGANFPLTVGGDDFFVGFRSPASLGVYSAQTGELRVVLDLCGDSDDLFFDARRELLYAICGEGRVATFGRGPSGYELVDEVDTARGARTGLYVPELDRLYVAAPAIGSEPARILILERQSD